MSAVLNRRAGWQNAGPFCAVSSSRAGLPELIQQRGTPSLPTPLPVGVRGPMRVSVGQQGVDQEVGYSRYLFKRSVALVPPKPKELERT